MGLISKFILINLHYLNLYCIQYRFVIIESIFQNAPFILLLFIGLLLMNNCRNEDKLKQFKLLTFRVLAVAEKFVSLLKQVGTIDD